MTPLSADDRERYYRYLEYLRLGKGRLAGSWLMAQELEINGILLRTAAVAERLGISRSAVYRRIREGRMIQPYLSIRGQKYWRAEDILP